MEQYQVERIFAEKMSGKNADRPELKAMLEYVREGDTLYIESISRLGRSTRDLLSIIDSQRFLSFLGRKNNSSREGAASFVSLYYLSVVSILYICKPTGAFITT